MMKAVLSPASSGIESHGLSVHGPFAPQELAAPLQGKRNSRSEEIRALSGQDEPSNRSIFEALELNCASTKQSRVAKRLSNHGLNQRSFVVELDMPRYRSAKKQGIRGESATSVSWNKPGGGVLIYRPSDFV
jgi:hypothetical protein